MSWFKNLFSPVPTTTLTSADLEEVMPCPDPTPVASGTWKGRVAKVYDCGCTATYGGTEKNLLKAMSEIPNYCPDHGPIGKDI